MSRKLRYDLQENKQRAAQFYRLAFNGNPKGAVEKYVGDRYIQHNPLVKDGKEGFIEYFEKMAREYPDKKVEVVRSVAEGDMVALHTHQWWPGGEEYITMDFFRFDEGGKITEHWDAIEKIPEQSANENNMY